LSADKGIRRAPDFAAIVEDYTPEQMMILQIVYDGERKPFAFALNRDRKRWI
jgi:hypothetical protein